MKKRNIIIFRNFLVGVVGNISACHADARGSIPRLGVFFFLFPNHLTYRFKPKWCYYK